MMSENDIELQKARTLAARQEADNLADEVVKAWDAWSYARKRESEAFAAYMLEERILSAMKNKLKDLE